MSISLKELELLIETLSPREYAYDWDNSGFNINLNNAEVTGIMLCLDVSEEIIEEATAKKCNLIISHHPLLFHAAKQINSETYQGKCIAALIRNDISLYCAHTSMDTAPQGINRYLADTLGLRNQEYLEETNVGRYFEVAVHVPESHVDKIRSAMSKAGAGNIGDYSECTYNIAGKGTFRPNDQANPYIGSSGNLETVDEVRVSAVCPECRLAAVLSAIRNVHPYEEPAISALVVSEPRSVNAGLGIVGDLEKATAASDVILEIKKKLEIDCVRAAGDLGRMISRVAVCGGAAGDMEALAKEKGAQLYLTGEIKHNFYMEAQDMVLIEAGHYDTEKCFCKLYAEGLQKLLDDVNYNVAIYIASLHRPYVNI